MAKKPSRAATGEGTNLKQPSWRFSEDLSIRPAIEGTESANKLLDELRKEIAAQETKPNKKSK